VLLGAAYLATFNVVLQGAASASLRGFLAGGVGVLLALLFFPTGLGGLVFGLRDAWLRRVAKRHHIFVPSLVADRRTFEEERVELAPLFDDQGRVADVPMHYRRESRIRTAGRSQTARVWR